MEIESNNSINGYSIESPTTVDHISASSIYTGDTSTLMYVHSEKNNIHDDVNMTGNSNIFDGNLTNLQAFNNNNFSIQQNTQILCCLCGKLTHPDPSRLCIDCLTSEIDLTSNISKTIVLPNCRDCKRYLFHRWLYCELESKELLQFCLKQIRGLNKVRLTNANFIWTEPHSKRIKIKVTIQKELFNNSIVEVSFQVEFIIQTSQCNKCKRLWTPHIWNARVQLRQKTSHKRTFLYLEQIILKHDAHENVINIVNQPDGLDFMFFNKNYAQKFADFVSNFFPIKNKMSKQLISHDTNSNSYYHKYTILSEICPICKDDLVWLSSKIASFYGGISQLLLCHNLTTSIHLVDPFSLKCADISSENYWKDPFKYILTRSNLTNFIIIDFEFKENPKTASSNSLYKKLNENKYKIAICDVARTSDFGYNNQMLTACCYVGNSLRAGDYWLGYDLSNLNLSGSDDKISKCLENLQCEVILVKRSPKAKKAARKPWKLHWLTKDENNDVKMNENIYKKKTDQDLQDFENDLEQSIELRKNVNLLRDPKFNYDSFNKEKTNNDDDEISEDDFKLEELMEALTLQEDEEFEDTNL